MVFQSKKINKFLMTMVFGLTLFFGAGALCIVWLRMEISSVAKSCGELEGQMEIVGREVHELRGQRSQSLVHENSWQTCKKVSCFKQDAQAYIRSSRTPKTRSSKTRFSNLVFQAWGSMGGPRGPLGAPWGPGPPAKDQGLV